MWLPQNQNCGYPRKELPIKLFISKHRPLDCIKAKSAISISEMTETLQFRSIAMVFANSWLGIKPFYCEERNWVKLQKDLLKNQKKKVRLIKTTILKCALGMEETYILVNPVHRYVKNCNSCEKRKASQKYVESNPNQIQGNIKTK